MRGSFLIGLLFWVIAFLIVNISATEYEGIYISEDAYVSSAEPYSNFDSFRTSFQQLKVANNDAEKCYIFLKFNWTSEDSWTEIPSDAIIQNATLGLKTTTGTGRPRLQCISVLTILGRREKLHMQIIRILKL